MGRRVARSLFPVNYRQIRLKRTFSEETDVPWDDTRRVTYSICARFIVLIPGPGDGEVEFFDGKNK